ncbi:MAG: aminoacetone oxidase family FAD-binding enzyme [Candidatus Nomurabacteria bacterium]|nr:aminoacetone oxidase family FAD-binding enzyme [Candidatus Nomurabacteria bacterium]
MRDNPKNHFDVIVIGGGASGMMAAGVAGARGKRVLILEKNKNLGEKLKITGGGRCNVANGEMNIREFLKIYGDGGKFLASPFSQFSSKDTFTFFEKLGLPLVVQARKRAFPNTEKAIDVVLALQKFLQKNNVVCKMNMRVSKINAEDGKITGVVASGVNYTADSFIFATGGISHPETGSTGDGFGFLRTLGHTIADPTPTIVPLAVKEEWVKSLAGVSLSFMKITFFADGVKKIVKKGKVLFTHFGLSGPLILNSAKEVGDLLEWSSEVTATIDAYPDTDHGALEKKIIKTFDENKNKMLKNIFKDITPLGTSEAILSILEKINPVRDGLNSNGVNPDTKVHSVTKEERKQIVNLLKALPVTITSLMGFDRAVIADGGITLKEIDMKTMRSTLYNNLYVTGDLLHINRPSGGFSLQLCWTTGFVAGSNA